VDNALCEEVAAICQKLRQLNTRLPEVAKLMAHMQNEATQEQLNKKTNIIIATPGKLLDLHRRGQVNLSTVKKFVLDQIDCFLLYADDSDIQHLLKLLCSNQHVIALTSRVTLCLKQRWNDVTPASTIALQNMINLPDTQLARIKKISARVHWVAYEAGKTQSLQNAEKAKKMAEKFRILIITNFKKMVDAISMEGQKLRPTEFARHRSELTDPDERYKSLKGFKDGTYKILVSTRRSIYGTSFPFLPIFLLAGMPRLYDEFLYLIQWSAQSFFTSRLTD
jgi:ATP-dependent RNA helicase RhlE